MELNAYRGRNEARGGGERDPFSEEKENLLLAFWIMDVGAGPPVDCPLHWREGGPEKFLSSLQLHFCTVASAIFLGNLLKEGNLLMIPAAALIRLTPIPLQNMNHNEV